MNKHVIYYVLQELCLLDGICKHPDMIYMVFIGPPVMETTSTMATGNEAGSAIIMGILTFIIITGQNPVSILMFTTLIMVIIFSVMQTRYL